MSGITVKHRLKLRLMAYIQLSLYGIPAVVIHGNTLTMETWSHWYTPCAAVPFMEEFAERGA